MMIHLFEPKEVGPRLRRGGGWYVGIGICGIGGTGGVDGTGGIDGIW